MAEENDNSIRDDIYSKAIRAGKRTYFFDVKSTRSNDLYLTITESKKRVGDEGRFYYEKHKLFLYKEDFDKFFEGLNEAIEHINFLKESDAAYAPNEYSSNEAYENEPNFNEIKFEDLGKDDR